jgi:hypothetical protein
MNGRREFAGLGSQQTDQKQNYPGGGADAIRIVCTLGENSFAKSNATRPRSHGRSERFCQGRDVNA